ncbi:MAG: aminotransferase class V-fold PLP-dependent enzyme, partial [Ilumatobacteraceae bacterium]
WATGLISSWEHWIDMPQRVGATLAPLIGARPGEVVVHDSTTVNLYQLVRAALRLRADRSVIAIDAGDFPTDRYVVDAIASADGSTVRRGFDDLSGVAVVVRSMIDYRSAEVVDLAAETARAHAAGALVVWDLSHAAGLHPVGLHAAGAQLAVGCTYKFLNGGPGAPAFTYVADDLIDQLDEPFHGWFAQHDQFEMGDRFSPRADIGRMLAGTPGILGLVAAHAGIEITSEAGIDAIRAKSIELGRFALACCDELGLTSATPRADERRGGHVCVNHPDAKRLTVELAARHHVLADFREPDVIRLGLSPLTTRFSDIARAATAIAAMT